MKMDPAGLTFMTKMRIACGGFGERLNLSGRKIRETFSRSAQLILRASI